MASTFKNFTADLTTTAQTTVYTAPAATQSIVFGLFIANVDGSAACDVTVEVTDTSGAVTRKIASTHSVPADGTWVCDKPIVLEATDVLKVTAGTANDLHVVGSVLEIS